MGNRRKRASGRTSGRGRDGTGSRQRQIIEALSIDVRSAISDPPAAMRCDCPYLRSDDDKLREEFDLSASLYEFLEGSIAASLTSRHGLGTERRREKDWRRNVRLRRDFSKARNVSRLQ